MPPFTREVGCRKASRRDFLKKIDFKKKVLRCLIPQSPAVTAPFTREPFDISPHRGESPFTREPFGGGGENQISVPPTGRM